MKTLTSIVVSPASTRVAFNKTKQFTANGFDQLGDPISTGTITWSATGGTITDGLFTAGETAGDFQVTAEVGELSATANVSVMEKVSESGTKSSLDSRSSFTNRRSKWRSL